VADVEVLLEVVAQGEVEERPAEPVVVCSSARVLS